MSTKHSRRERDFGYMADVKQLRCLMAGNGRCEGVVEADHAGDRAGFRRAADDTCIPLCTRHHRDRHEATGPFAVMTQEERREWRADAIAETKAAVARLRSGRGLL